MADPTKPGNSEKLADLLKFDAAKRHPLTNELFGEVVKEITEERVKASKVQAKEALTKAMDLRAQMHKAQKDFSNQQAKFEKELGKILNQVQGMLSGKEADEEKDEKEEPATT